MVLLHQVGITRRGAETRLRSIDLPWEAYAEHVSRGATACASSSTSASIAQATPTADARRMMISDDYTTPGNGAHNGLTFDLLAELISEGKEVPGIRDIPDELNVRSHVASADNRRPSRPRPPSCRDDQSLGRCKHSRRQKEPSSQAIRCSQSLRSPTLLRSFPDDWVANPFRIKLRRTKFARSLYQYPTLRTASARAMETVRWRPADVPMYTIRSLK